jgi:hypothetical protein
MEIRDAIAKMDAINLFSSRSPTPGFPPPMASSSHTSASSDTAMSKLNSSQEAQQQNTVPEGNGALLRVKTKVAQRSAPPRAVQTEEVSTSPQPQRQWTSPPPTRVSVGARVLDDSVARHVCLPLPLLFPVRCRAIRPRVKCRWCISCNMIMSMLVACRRLRILKTLKRQTSRC